MYVTGHVQLHYVYKSLGYGIMSMASPNTGAKLAVWVYNS